MPFEPWGLILVASQNVNTDDSIDQQCSKHVYIIPSFSRLEKVLQETLFFLKKLRVNVRRLLYSAPQKGEADVLLSYTTSQGPRVKISAPHWRCYNNRSYLNQQEVLLSEAVGVSADGEVPHQLLSIQCWHFALQLLASLRLFIANSQL